MRVTIILVCAVVGGAASENGRGDDFTVNTKSFISRIGSDGLTSGEKVMACVVNAGIGGSEDPKGSDRASGQFRLFSSVTYSARCANGNVTVALKRKELGNGKEFVVFTTSGKWDPEPPSASGPAKTVKVSYGMSGEPNVAGNCLMAAAKPRVCTWIWHSVVATFSCSADAPTVDVQLKGSDFPSHRAWINGNCSKELKQQSFDSLWQCQSGSDASKVHGAALAHSCGR